MRIDNSHPLGCVCDHCEDIRNTPRTIFVHGPYRKFETMTPEEAMRLPLAPFVPPLEPTPAREFFHELEALMEATGRILFTHQHCPEGHDHPFPFACDVYGNEYCDHCWFRDGVATMLMPCGPDNCGIGVS